jgi:hypothetical protein
MRVLVQEAADHNSCMAQIRATYSKDCTVVYGYKTSDRYRMIIALESDNLKDDETPVTRPQHAQIKTSQGPSTRPNIIEGEITPALLDLAARVKALEEASFPSGPIGPESPEFKEIIFSDVLSNKAPPSTEGCANITSSRAEKAERTESLNLYQSPKSITSNNEGPYLARELKQSFQISADRRLGDSQIKDVSDNARRFADIMTDQISCSSKSSLTNSRPSAARAGGRF